MTQIPPDDQEPIRIGGRTLRDAIIMLPGVSKDPITTPAILRLVAEFEEERQKRAAAAIERAVELIRTVYLTESAGGPLHIVTDDGNIDDHHVKWAADHLDSLLCELDGELVAVVREVVPLLVGMPVADRALVLARVASPWLPAPGVGR